MPPRALRLLLAHQRKHTRRLASNGRSLATCLFDHFKFKTNQKACHESCLTCVFVVVLFQKTQQDMGYNNLANFAIEKKIGRGQFSEVYRARCLLDHTPVALKKIQVRNCFNVFDVHCKAELCVS